MAAYEIQPKTYEEFILLRGIGPGTIRALALIAELIYDAKLCWKDPIRYTFAVGGKDGVPYTIKPEKLWTDLITSQNYEKMSNLRKSSCAKPEYS